MRWLTAGESHGPGLTVIVDDVPAGVPVSSDAINRDLARRQQGYGRGPRMKIETDTAQFKGGVRFGKTTGAPVALWVENRDAGNWLEVMAPEGKAGEPAAKRKFVRPRPGHADLAGYVKYGSADLRDVLERASARETAARVAAGGIAKCMLTALGITVFSHVRTLGGVSVDDADLEGLSLAQLHERAEANDCHCAGSEQTLAAMRAAVDQAMADGTTLGGDIEVIAYGVPVGLGSYVQWDRKLDGLLAQAVMSIQAVKAVAIGAGAEGGQRRGHQFHDEIVAVADAEKTTALGDDSATPKINVSDANTLYRPTNRAGGLEGGVTNGAPLIVRATMKPISTLRKPLRSVNLETGKTEEAHFERSDVTAVPACGVVAEAMVALTLATAWQQRFGSDQLNLVH